MQKYYAVCKGREGPKIYTSWEECNKSISGFPGAKYKSFGTQKEAVNFIIGNGYVIKFIQTDSDTSVSIPKVLYVKITNPLISFKDHVFDKIIAYTDGSCINQGTSRAKAGAGIYFPQLDIGYSSPVLGKQTNNRGELYSVILAIKIVTETWGNNIPLEIYTDSSYVINNIKSNNKTNIDLWDRLKHGMANTTFIKVKAHSGDKCNEKADKFAKVYAYK
jgi:ribonuclease HI